MSEVRSNCCKGTPMTWECRLCPEALRLTPEQCERIREIVAERKPLDIPPLSIEDE